MSASEKRTIRVLSQMTLLRQIKEDAALREMKDQRKRLANSESALAAYRERRREVLEASADLQHEDQVRGGIVLANRRYLDQLRDQEARVTQSLATEREGWCESRDEFARARSQRRASELVRQKVVAQLEKKLADREERIDQDSSRGARRVGEIS